MVEQGKVFSAERKEYIIDGRPIIMSYVRVTPAIAAVWLTHNHNNRSIAQNNLKHLISEMTNGNWKFDGDPIRFDDKGNLLNAQHRLMAILATGKSFVFKVIEGLDPNSFETMDSGAKKTGGKVFTHRGVSNPTVAAGATKFVYGMRRGHRSENIIKQDNRTLSNPDLVKGYLNLPNIDESVVKGIKYASKFDRVINNNTMAGLHYLLSEKSRVAADDFLNKLSTGLNLELDSPIYILRNRLYLSDSDNNHRITFRDKVAHVIMAWNKYRAGETCMRLVIPEDFDFEIAD